MLTTQRLVDLAEEIDGILNRFSRDREGIHINPSDTAKFDEFVLEAAGLCDDAFGPLNKYSRKLESEAVFGRANFFSSQSYNSVQRCSAIIRAAASHAKRTTETNQMQGVVGKTFIAAIRITELNAIDNPEFDLRKLCRLCEELNSSYSSGSYFATLALARSIIDHVPPIFGCKNFSEFANNQAGRSLKPIMQRLDSETKKLADIGLHEQASKYSDLPNSEQVAFQPALDKLLSEVIKKLGRNDE